ncbi:MAG: hypothetical protein QOF03_1983 [Alphaproteobacteria bacterium]|nr:hypothetical protein [Alphaproteobacteria bacterium]
MAGRPQKFPALRKYLENKANEYRYSGETEPLAMTFSEIEALGDVLPTSARKHRAWWANGSAEKPWERARFHTENVRMEEGRLTFRYFGPYSPDGRARQEEKTKASKAAFRQTLADLRLRGVLVSPPEPRAPAGMADVARAYAQSEKMAGTPPRCRHPAYGALKGYIRLVAGTDLTEPADPEWGERVWGDDTK